jgi:hypothetical protein
MVVALATGIRLFMIWEADASTFSLKWTLIAVVIIVALVHQFTAKRTSAAVRGVLQLVILLVSVGIFAAAVSLPY